MAFLGPRVGKVNVQALNALLGKVVDNEIPGITTEHANIWQIPSAGPVGGIFIVFVGPFDAKVIGPGIRTSGINQKSTLAGAYLQLYRMVVAEYLLPIHFTM